MDANKTAAAADVNLWTSLLAVKNPKNCPVVKAKAIALADEIFLFVKFNA